MKFEFDGIEFDTDKPIYVFGITFGKGWSHFCESDFNIRCIKEYGSASKKLYVDQLTFNLQEQNGKLENELVLINFISRKGDITARINSECIIGHSPKECIEIYKKRVEGRINE
jgi:hypothetical protein